MVKRNRSDGIPIKEVHEKIIHALSNVITYSSCTSDKPLIVGLNEPVPYKFRIYAFNCSNPPGGRPIDEYKVVLNVGQDYGEIGNFDYSDGCLAIVLGYINKYDVFVLWDTMKHINLLTIRTCRLK